MSAITYEDSFGDAVTEYPPVRAGDETVYVSHNPTGFRLLPRGCWCKRPATFHVLTKHRVGESQLYVCGEHLPDDIREQHWEPS